MKVLLVGANGQLGKELRITAPQNVELIALNHQQLDITQADFVQQVVLETKPHCIINAAAYNFVDLAETERDLAYLVNAIGPFNLAQAAYIHGARLIHVSTDYVFNGEKKSPYLPTDIPSPVSWYGETKVTGEEKALQELPDQTLILRTSWVYSSHGKNFVKSLLQWLQEKSELKIVDDQISVPTWAKTLAQAIWSSVEKPSLKGIYHWTDDGMANKYDFAIAIRDEALKLGLLKKEVIVRRAKSSDFVNPAKRPPYSVLDKAQTERDLGLSAVAWQTALSKMLIEIKNHA